MNSRWHGVFTLFQLILVTVFVEDVQAHHLRNGAPHAELWRRADVNPATPYKFPTIPDANATIHDFSVFAEDPLSSWDDDTLTLTTTTLIPGDYHARMGLANGYIGIGEASLGPFFEVDFNQTNAGGLVPTEGWPEYNPRLAFATVAGFLDRQATTNKTNYPELQAFGDESVISGIPHFSGMYLVVGDQVLNATVNTTTITEFQSSMNYMNATKHWSFVWTPQGTSLSFKVEYMTFMSRARPNVAATQMQVTSLGSAGNVSIMDILDGRSAIRSYAGQRGSYNDPPSIYSSNHPNGLWNVTAWTVSTVNASSGYADETSRTLVYPNSDNMTMGQQWNAQLPANQTATFQKFVGIASSDKFPDAESTAMQASLNATEDGWDVLLAEHTTIWNKDMQQNQIPNYRDPTTGKLPVNDTVAQRYQTAAVVNFFMIMQNLLPENGDGLNDNGISVGGLSADPYAGMYFWDQDIWMFPSIALTSPTHALQIIKYRLSRYQQAKLNAQVPYVQKEYQFDNESVLYSWTAGRYANATGTGPTLDYEYHINADIVLAMLQYRIITGDEDYFRKELWPVVKSVGHTIQGLEKLADGKWNIHNMTDPDEWTNQVDNGAFTQAAFLQVLNAIISTAAQYSESIPTIWYDIAQNINIPRAASGIILESDGMPANISVKQADVTLFMYPLSLSPANYTLQNKNLDLSFYTSRQTLDGPAMTFAINTIATLRYAASGCAAHTYDLMSGFNNYRTPWYQMSEQTNDDPNANGGYPPAFPFLTGHGGAAQIPVFGYLGFDLWQSVLTVQPTLPPPLSYLQVPDFYFHGHRISASLNATHTNITLLALSPYVSGNMTSIPLIQNLPASRKPQVYFTLSLNETLTLQNDMYWQGITTEGNAIQCQQVLESSEEVEGRWPQGVVDGDVGTAWQPVSADLSALVLDTGGLRGRRVSEVRIYWGDRVASWVRVVLVNSTMADAVGANGTVPLGPEGDLNSTSDKNSTAVIDGELGLGIQTNTTIIIPQELLQNNSTQVNAESAVTPNVGFETRYVADMDVDAVGQEWYLGDRAVLMVEGCVGEGCFESGDMAGATVGELEFFVV